MTLASFRRLWLAFVAGVATLFPASSLTAQDADHSSPPATFNELGNSRGIGAFLSGATGGADELRIEGSLKVTRGQRTGVLEIRATLAPKWHVYAVDQTGGPGPTKITVPGSDPVRLTGAFRPDKQPEVRKVEVFDVPLREHYGEVTWSAPVELAAGADPEKLKLQVRFDGQICNDDVGCKPVFGKKIEIAFGGFIDAAETTPAEGPTTGAKPAAADVRPAGDVFRAVRAHVSLQGHVEPAIVPPGGKLRLAITAWLDPGWHVYAYAPRDPQQVAKPTLIVITQPASWPCGAVAASQDPLVKKADGEQPAISYHERSVTWTAELTVPADAAAGEHSVAGIIGYQTCTETGCDRPQAARFTATVTVGGTASDERRPLAFTADRYAEAAQLAAAGSEQPSPTPDAAAKPEMPAAEMTHGTTDKGRVFDLSKLKPRGDSQASQSLLAILGIAMLGGFILNFMPCVLPVVGLKVLSFVQQAGEHRARVFALNLWYSLGVMSVFLALATLASVFNLSWGEQFTSDAFRVTMAAVVFVMGLSFLGVWEIPVPGFVGSGTASELAQRKGIAGAFSKGILTTILATPCSGPGLAVALAWCIGKPAILVYLVFAAMGLGMALPYLMIGAFPRLARFLPQPGAWMETFKEIMGFVLLAVVVLILSFVKPASVIPTLALLFILWAACWWIGRTPITAEFQVKLRAWLAAAVFCVVLGFYAFSSRIGAGAFHIPGLLGVMEGRLRAYVIAQTDPTTLIEKLQRLTSENKTVLVDFTADWCLTCKFLEHTVLNTDDVQQALAENGVVKLVADWTNGDPEISGILDALGSKQVPVIAIFPAGRPNEPIVLMGGYTKATLLEKLQEAGPSQNVPGQPAGRIANVPTAGA